MSASFMVPLINIFLRSSKWYSGYWGWGCCAKFCYDKIIWWKIKPTKTKNALTDSDAERFPEVWRSWKSRFIFMNFSQGKYDPVDRELTFRKWRCEYHGRKKCVKDFFLSVKHILILFKLLTLLWFVSD